MFRVRYKGEQFFRGEPILRQKTLKIDGFPHTFHSHPIIPNQNGDGSYNYTKEEFDRIDGVKLFEDFNLWEVIEIPDILVMESETGGVKLECPYCDKGPDTTRIAVLNMHIGRFHPEQAGKKLSLPDVQKKDDFQVE
jgi:hypothetical protein